MRVIIFQPRFAELVRAGSKCQTIRKTARCKTGDALSLRRWTGKPYRSKQETLRTAICMSVESVSIGHGIFCDGIAVNGEECDTSARASLSRADGFSCATDMLDWFRETHGLPFAGFIIRWNTQHHRAE